MLLADRVVLVLVEPQDVVNVGAVMRVMLNYGLRRLRVVNPAAALDPARLDDLAHRSQEIIAARRLFERQNWPVIDITRRSVEETAAAVINLLSAGRGKVEVLG